LQSASSVRKDFVASNLRAQVSRLSALLNRIEDGGLDYNYANASLKEVETNLKKVRKLVWNETNIII
jgi:hypothetical protein